MIEIEWTAFMRGFVFWETPRSEFGPPDPAEVADLAEWLAGFQQAFADYPTPSTRKQGNPSPRPWTGCWPTIRPC